MCLFAHCLTKGKRLLISGDARDVFWDEFRMGRVTALAKPDGGMRGIVVGDVFRRLIARTIAQEIGETVQSATAPYQYALKTRAGTECVSHILQTLVESDANATIISIDGIGAFDLVSRNAMLRGLKEMDAGDRVLPFVRLRCTFGRTRLEKCRTYLRERVSTKVISSCHCSSVSPCTRLLREGEKLFAFLDEVYLVCQPERVLKVFRLVETALWIHSRISVHRGKTQLWNRSGTTPSPELPGP